MSEPLSVPQDDAQRGKSLSTLIPNHCIPWDEDCTICNPPLTPNPDDAPQDDAERNAPTASTISRAEYDLLNDYADNIRVELEQWKERACRAIHTRDQAILALHNTIGECYFRDGKPLPATTRGFRTGDTRMLSLRQCHIFGLPDLYAGNYEPPVEVTQGNAPRTEPALDIEAYIRRIPWSGAATEDEKALVAGNLRTYHHTIFGPSPGEQGNAPVSSVTSEPETDERPYPPIPPEDRKRGCWVHDETTAGCELCREVGYPDGPRGVLLYRADLLDYLRTDPTLSGSMRNELARTANAIRHAASEA